MDLYIVFAQNKKILHRMVFSNHSEILQKRMLWPKKVFVLKIHSKVTKTKYGHKNTTPLSFQIFFLRGRKIVICHLSTLGKSIKGKNKKSVCLKEVSTLLCSLYMCSFIWTSKQTLRTWVKCPS